MRSASSRFTHVTVIVTTHTIIIEAELQMQNTFTRKYQVPHPTATQKHPVRVLHLPFSYKKKCTLFKKNCWVQVQASPSSEPIPAASTDLLAKS